MPKRPESTRLRPPRLTVKELAGLLGCPFEGDGGTLITGVAGLQDAREGDLVFLGQARMHKLLEESKASAAIIPPDEPFRRIPVILAEDPQWVFVRAVEIFFQPYRPAPGVHPAAVISPSAKLGEDVSVGAFSVIGDEVVIGRGAVIFPLCCIYPRVRIGEGSVLHSLVSVREDIRIGNRVLVHNGVVLGSDGFGYVRRGDGSYHKIPQKGTVVIEDDVEIGANSAVDRATFGATVVRRGVKIDNLVQVAHNVEIGENSILAGQAGIAGSVTIGKSVVLAGQVGVADHVKVGDRVIAAAQTGIAGNVADGSFVGGTPHLDVRDWKKASVALPQLYDFIKEVKRLKARVEELERLAKIKG